MTRIKGLHFSFSLKKNGVWTRYFTIHLSIRLKIISCLDKVFETEFLFFICVLYNFHLVQSFQYACIVQPSVLLKRIGCLLYVRGFVAELDTLMIIFLSPIFSIHLNRIYIAYIYLDLPIRTIPSHLFDLIHPAYYMCVLYGRHTTNG